MYYTITKVGDLKMSNLIDELKNRLKKALKYANMKPIELSEKTGIPKSSISQYMSGYAKPNTERLYLICKVLNVSESWLMGFDVPIERRPSNILVDEPTNDIIAEIVFKLRSDSNFRHTIYTLTKYGELSTVKQDLINLVYDLTEAEASVLLVACRIGKENEKQNN